MTLFDCPSELVWSIIANFLDPRSFVRLNTSVCNKKTRECLLFLYQTDCWNNTKSRSRFPRSFSATEWLLRQGIMFKYIDTGSFLWLTCDELNNLLNLFDKSRTKKVVVRDSHDKKGIQKNKLILEARFPVIDVVLDSMNPEYIDGLTACASTLTSLLVQNLSHLTSLAEVFTKHRPNLHTLMINTLSEKPQEVVDELISILTALAGSQLKVLAMRFSEEQHDALQLCRAIVQSISTVETLVIGMHSGLNDECLRVLAEGCHRLTKCNFVGHQDNDGSGVLALFAKHPATLNNAEYCVLHDSTAMRLCRNERSAHITPLLCHLIAKRKQFEAPPTASPQEMSALLNVCKGVQQLTCSGGSLPRAALSHACEGLYSLDLHNCQASDCAAILAFLQAWRPHADSTARVKLTWKACEGPSVDLCEELLRRMKDHNIYVAVKLNRIVRGNDDDDAAALELFPGVEVLIEAAPNRPLYIVLKLNTLSREQSFDLWALMRPLLSSLLAAIEESKLAAASSIEMIHCNDVTNEVLVDLCVHLPPLNHLGIENCHGLTDPLVDRLAGHWPSFARYSFSSQSEIPADKDQLMRLEEARLPTRNLTLTNCRGFSPEMMQRVHRVNRTNHWD